MVSGSAGGATIAELLAAKGETTILEITEAIPYEVSLMPDGSYALGYGIARARLCDLAPQTAEPLRGPSLAEFAAFKRKLDSSLVPDCAPTVEHTPIGIRFAGEKPGSGDKQPSQPPPATPRKLPGDERRTGGVERPTRRPGEQGRPAPSRRVQPK